MVQDSSPRLAARAKNFTLGLKRAFVVSPDGRRILFLRSKPGTSSSHSLWLYDVTSRTERELADPAVLLEECERNLTAEERARRERMRVTSSGVVAFSTDEDSSSRRICTVVSALRGRRDTGARGDHDVVGD